MDSGKNEDSKRSFSFSGSELRCAKFKVEKSSEKRNEHLEIVNEVIRKMIERNNHKLFHLNSNKCNCNSNSQITESGKITKRKLKTSSLRGPFSIVGKRRLLLKEESPVIKKERAFKSIHEELKLKVLEMEMKKMTTSVSSEINDSMEFMSTE